MATVTAFAFDPVYGVEECKICNQALDRMGADHIADSTENTKQSRACAAVYALARDEMLRNFNFATRTALVPIDDVTYDPLDGFAYLYKAEDWDDFTGVASSTAVITGVTGITIDEALIGRVVTGQYVPENATIIAVGTTSITLDRPTTGAATAFTAHIDMTDILSVAADPDSTYQVYGVGEAKRILTDAPQVVSGTDTYMEIKYTERVKDPASFTPGFKEALILNIAYKIVVKMVSDMRLLQILQGEFAAQLQIARNRALMEMNMDSPMTKWTDRGEEA